MEIKSVLVIFTMCSFVGCHLPRSKQSIIETFLQQNDDNEYTTCEKGDEPDKLINSVDEMIHNNNKPIYRLDENGKQSKTVASEHDEHKETQKENIIINKNVVDQKTVENDENHVFDRIRLPTFDKMKVGRKVDILLPGDVQSTMKLLSLNPFVFEVEDFIDEDDCKLLIDLAKAKSLKPIYSKFPDVQFKNAEQTFKEWDLDQNGVITPYEVTLLQGLADVKFTEEDVDDMMFVLKMDSNGDGQIDIDEMKGTNFETAKKYFDEVKSDERRKRNITSSAAWVWHDSDELLKFSNDGYFEKYHERISTLTGIPSQIIEESEPLQVKLFKENQFQQLRQDSEPFAKDIACCLYGDIGKVCRLCRYISFAIFLNDVEEGGELAFPLANHKFQDVMNNSGEWRGYYLYAKTTGNKFYFKVNVTFSTEGANRVFKGVGKDESGGFEFVNTIIIGQTVKLEKKYTEGSVNDNKINYHGKIIEGTKISGKWWVPGHPRLRGTFFMWNRGYEIFSAKAIDESNQIEGCLKSSLVIKPKKGKAVFWYNHHLNPRDGMVGDLNQESMSAQCEVTKSEKWIATSWINIIGDGDLSLRAWRRGNNLLTSKSNNIYKMLGTTEKKLTNENYEKEYLEEVHGTNGTREELAHAYYKHKPASNALQALNLLFNDMTGEQLKYITAKVHQKLSLTCIPLTVEHAGKVTLVDGSVE